MNTSEIIPMGRARRDIIGMSQTGTGETIAFVRPMIAELIKHDRKSALILVPTGDLALQVREVIEDLTDSIKGLSSVVVLDGMPKRPEAKSLAGKPRIIIATPGRLIEHLRRGRVSLRSCEIVVLDGTDRMLDMGFSAQIKEIFKFVPSGRQTLLFSTTMPPETEKFASKYLRNPLYV